MDMALKVEGLCKAYDGFALEDISFNLPYGAVMGFIGANGAGKTTTIKSILGLIKSQGRISLLGGGIYDMDMRQKIGVVLDECSAYDNFTLPQIAKVERALRRNWSEDLWQSYISRFELPIKKQVKSFSRGMRMKLFIALALVHQPQLLILDEATGGLDPVMREEVLDIFWEFIQEENHAILLSSHITGDLDKLADYITFIHQGKLVFSRDKLSLQEDMAVLRCPEADLAAIPGEFVLRYRVNHFGCEALVQKRRQLAQLSPHLVLENASTEEIMLLYSQGRAK